MPVRVEQWKAKDGSLHNTEYKADLHESAVDVKKLLLAKLKKLRKDYPGECIWEPAWDGSVAEVLSKIFISSKEEIAKILIGATKK